MVLDEELKGVFAPVAKELNLSNKGAQRIADLKIENDKLNHRRWGEHLDELRTQAKADPEIGGAKYNQSLATAKAAMKKYGTPELTKVMNQYGVGAHPEMIRAWARVGLAMGETPLLPSGEGSGAVKRPLHEILYADQPSAGTTR